MANNLEQFNGYATGILMAYGAFILGIFSPGPNILSIIGTSMGVGRESGKALALGIASGSFLWGSLTWIGLTAVLTLYASVIVVIKVVGAAYLLWLALRAFRSAATSNEFLARRIDVTGGSWAYYRRGLIIQMTNPKAALTWIAIMSLAVNPGAPLWVGGSIVAGTTVVSLIGHRTYAILFSSAPVVAAYRRIRRGIEAGFGAFFCFASYKLLTSKT